MSRRKLRKLSWAEFEPHIRDLIEQAYQQGWNDAIESLEVDE